MPDSLSDLRRQVYGTSDEELASLQAMVNRGLSYSDMMRAAAIAPKPFVSGRYYFTPNHAQVSTSGSLTTAMLRFVPVTIPNDCVINRIGSEIAVIGDAGSKLRLGIYRDDNGRPGALLLDAGTIAGDSATSQEITINQALEAGTYWFAAVVQVVTASQPTVRIQSLQGLMAPNLENGTAIPSSAAVRTGFTLSGVTGALPADPSSAIPANTNIPRIFVKVA